MTLAELHAELGALLAAEQADPVDWPAVEQQCLCVIHRLNTELGPGYPHDVVYHFLDDPDVRRKSADYARNQWERLAFYLDASHAL